MVQDVWRRGEDGEIYIGKTTITIRSKDADWLHRQERRSEKRKEPIYSVVWRVLDAFREKDIDGYLQNYSQLHNAHQGTLQLVEQLKSQIVAKDAEIEELKKSQGLMQYDEVKTDLDIIREKPLSETSKLKTFTDVFNGLAGEDKNDVEAQNLIKELISTGKFEPKEPEEFIKKAMQNGQIYEARAGFYSKA